MTKVTIGRNYIEIDGHSKKAIVCHAISAVTQMTAHYIERNSMGVIQTSEDAYTKITIHDNHLDSDLLKALIDTFLDLSNQYPDCITVNFN